MPTVHDWQEGEELTEQQERQLQCAHAWVANSGQGGEPEFRMNRMMSRVHPLMHVRCRLCGTRTWFSYGQWEALPASGKT